MRRLVVLLGLLAAVGVFFALGLDDLLTLSEIKARQVDLQATLASQPIATAVAFFGVYVAVTAVSLPGAALLTLAAGALFGVLEGTVLVSFASSIGATLAFLTSRYLFRDAVRARFGAKLGVIDQGVATDGAFYLFTLRLVPAVPFFLINLLMGLTPIRARTFYSVSQLGMLPGTLVYVNAGTQLAEIESLRDIGSPALLASLVALGLFPWIVRAGLGWIRARRLYSRFSKPARFDRNLVVIGAGAAGLVSAYIAAAVKAKVTLVEADKMGGDCLNHGCVPSKALIKSAKIAHEVRHSGAYGVDASAPTIAFRSVMDRVRAVIAAIEPHDSVERYTGLGVEVILGRAEIVDPWTVAIRRADSSEVRLTTRSIIIAAGSSPTVPPLPGLDEVGFVTSDTLWDRFATLDAAPARLAVLGGGPIGCELSQAFARLGSRVTLIEAADQLLGREDDDTAHAARKLLENAGVEVLCGCKAQGAAVTDAGKALSLESARGPQSLIFDELIVAVGRTPRLAGYGLENLGIDTGKGRLADAHLQTMYPNIFAAGDVAGSYQFTHTAAHQAWYAAVNALFGFARKFRADYRVIPRIVFTDPEIAVVGLTEREARAQNVEYEVTRFPMHELDRAIVDGATEGFVKVLTAGGKDQILGVTIVGQNAGETIAECVLAMKHGIGLNKVLGTIHSYPTMAEANKYAAGAWKRARVPVRLLSWLERLHAWRRG